MLDATPSRPPRTVAVVGGGISGLAAAYDLAARGVDCTVIESSGRLGGVIRTERLDECLVEGGPDSFLAQKPWALELIRELGLAADVIGSNDERRRTFVVRGGRLIALPDGLQFLAPTKIMPVLTTRLLSPAAKLRLLLEWLRRPNERARDRSIADFVLEHYGREVNEYLAQPLLTGVYGGAPEQLSLEAVMPRFLELERRHGSISRGLLAARHKEPPKPAGSLFLTLKGGMQQLVDALAGRLQGRMRIVYEEAAAVQASPAGYRIVLPGGGLDCDAVILAIPAWSAAKLLRGRDAGLADSLDRIPYCSSITGAFVYHRPPFARALNGFGFLVPRAEGRLLAACTWVNTKFDHRVPPGRAFLRAFIAGRAADRRLDSPSGDLAAAMQSELQQIMGFQAEPAAVQLFRWPRSMAQYQVGHVALATEIEERLLHHPGLHISGNAFGGIGVPDCIRRSRAIVRAMFEKS